MTQGPIIGVIADVHSNSVAFRTCIEYMEKQGCEEFLLLGDYVSDTADTGGTLTLLSELMQKYPCRILRGNREDYMTTQRKLRRELALSGEKLFEEKRSGEKLTEEETEGGEERERIPGLFIPGSAAGNLLYTYEKLTDGDLDFFESLPITFRYEKDGYPAITCCHGSPFLAKELLQLDEQRVREVLMQIDTDYLIAGHTHYQGIREIGGKVYINTGACGIAIGDPGRAHGVILQGKMPDTEQERQEAETCSGAHPVHPGTGAYWEAELLRIPYDTDLVVKNIFDSGLYDMAPWFLNNNLYTLLEGVDLTPDMVRLAAALQEDAKGESAVWPYIEEQYFEAAAGRLGIPDYKYLKEQH